MGERAPEQAAQWSNLCYSYSRNDIIHQLHCEVQTSALLFSTGTTLALRAMFCGSTGVNLLLVVLHDSFAGVGPHASASTVERRASCVFFQCSSSGCLWIVKKRAFKCVTVRFSPLAGINILRLRESHF